MHLALQDNRTQAVLQLLKFDKGLVRVKGREGFTPLHHVVQTGDDDLLIKFLKVCPEAIEDVTVRNETVFHLAVVEVLLKHLHRYQINAKNLEGLTALDIQSQYPWN
ncbi:hypothetical protein Gogos_003883, partial [Gossypium gossypioides]|nr:hypothetical protein [Gossypium gossypioides]